MQRGVLLTGRPGIGKSTACRRVAELCASRGIRVEGFLTEELRERGGRVGFDIVGLGAESTRRAPLARVGRGSGPRVGRYNVALSSFESLVLPIIDRLAAVDREDGITVFIVDEIGKMELCSLPFVERMQELFRTLPVPMLCTVALRGGGFIADVKHTPGFELIELREETRDAAPAGIVERLLRPGGPRVGATDVASECRPARWRRRGQAAEAPSTMVQEAVAPSTAAGGPRVGVRRLVLWLRSELRLADNPLLERAIAAHCEAESAAFLPVVCLDPSFYGPHARSAFGQPRVGEIRRRFFEESVADLRASLSHKGSQLLVCDAAPETVLPAIAGAGGLVVAARQVCTEEVSSEARCREALRAVGATLELLDGGGIGALFGQDDLQAAGLRTGQNFPEDFQVFYSLARSRLPAVCRQGLSPAPQALPSVGVGPACEPPGLRSATSASCLAVGHRLEAHPSAGPGFQGGETAGLARMRSWLHGGGLPHYKATFRRLLGDYSSRLSAHLAIGCISPRRLVAEALDAAGGLSASPHVEHFVYELCWRDFFRHASQRWGATLFQRGGPLGDTRCWARDPEAECRWREGRTGVPLVDAAMRELQATGYLGNLARQLAASYLVEELGLDWRVGADWFESSLVDYDPHSNWGQWARSAGVAPRSESKQRRVGGGRYYDIALGLPGGEAASYVRAWLPELAELADGDALAPWRCSGRPPELCSPHLRRRLEAAAAAGATPAKGTRASQGGGGWRANARRR
uniref:Cryptochrome DASH n=1 Tax=Lingulaulax polyedra TaxID=160621 RepID=A0A516AG46_LINPO|nr:cryptochrome DASH [Lingulodinium polyedra]